MSTPNIHRPDAWSLNDSRIEGPNIDGYPTLFVVMHAEPHQVRAALAAPQLLAALNAVVAWMEEPCTKESVNPLPAARAAIADAEGR